MLQTLCTPALSRRRNLPPASAGDSGTLLAAPVQAGASLAPDTGRVLADAAQAAALVERITGLRRASMPVCICPIGLGAGNEAIRRWQRFCEALHEGLLHAGQRNCGLGVALPGHVMPPEAGRLIADAILGPGPRYLLLDTLQFGERGSARVRERALRTWSFLFRQRGQAWPTLPAYAEIVRSGCPLLGGEVARSLVPNGGLQAPAGSAWSVVDVPLSKFADAAGCLDESALHGALGDALETADSALDRQTWPDSALALDARVNRRLGFVVHGFGDLAARRQIDPADLGLQRSLAKIAERIREHLYAVSGRLAARSQPLPALQMPDLTAGWQNGERRNVWNSALQDAIRRSAVRHRNLVVMSPYSVLPRERRATPAYADLLPVIAHADAWAFSGTPSFDGWAAAEFRKFHRQARAIIEHCHASSFVAAGV